MRLCAICSSRPATEVDRIDGRAYEVCSACVNEEVAEPPPPPPMRWRVFQAVRRQPGVQSTELCESMGMASHGEKSHVTTTLSRLVSQGAIRFEGRGQDRFYYAVEAAPQPKRVPKRVEMLGLVFGSLTIVADGGTNGSGNKLWRCACVCGRQSTVRGTDLRRGKTTSCGCLQGNRRPAAPAEESACAT